MEKTKLVIPNKGIYEVFRNELRFCPELHHEPGKQRKDFTNPNFYYIMNIDKKVNSIHSKTGTFFHDMNICGPLEINMDCDVTYSGLTFHLCDDDSWGEERWNPIPELTLNTTPGHEIDFSVNQDKNLKPEHNFLKKVTIKADTVHGHYNNCTKIEELTFDCKEIGRLSIHTKNLKKLNFPSLETFEIPSNSQNYYSRNYGLNIFEPLDLDYNHKPIYDLIPDSCVITLPKSCKLMSDFKFETGFTPLNKKFTLKDIKMEDIFSPATAGSYKDNGKTFSVKFQEFKNLISEQFVKKFDTIIVEEANNVKTQKEINKVQFAKKVKTK